MPRRFQILAPYPAASWLAGGLMILFPAGLMVAQPTTLISATVATGGRDRPSDEATQAPVSGDAALRCQITTDQMAWRVGEAPTIHVRIINDSDHPVWLVGSLDASSAQWRYPHCFFELSGPPEFEMTKLARCGFTNVLRREDFVQVRSGEAFDPYQRIDDYGFFGSDQLIPSNFTTPGTYTLRFVYSTLSEEPGEWFGTGNPAAPPQGHESVEELLERVPRLRIESNELQITIIE